MSRFNVLIMFSAMVLCVIVGSSAGWFPGRPRDDDKVCPPVLLPRTCWEDCDTDDDCKEGTKCCGTECGGRVCRIPITVQKYWFAVRGSTVRPPSSPRHRDGTCPLLLSPQICWNMCDVDDDCPKDNKCCVTGCGGRVCSSPIIEEPKQIMDLKNPLAEYTYNAYLKHIGGLHCSMAGVCWIRSFCQWIENAGSKPSNCI